ncbi:MAG: S-layer homology domain-containing protein [Clostridia bacterium]|nr:S-layer homology domain-containing protein [Clostridia bacterium]
MFKKTCALLLALCLSAVLPALAASDEGKLALISSLGIMHGYEDGSFRLENTLTRGEFSKIAVLASKDRKKISSAMAVSPFSDVPYTLWSAPYIQLASTNGYVNGYLDSTFRPNASITLAEASAVFLRLLGYTNSEFGAAWPAGHMAIAADEGLTADISCGPNDAITRRDTVTLLYNLLDCKIHNGDADYITMLDCISYDNVVLCATNQEDASIPTNKVLTSVGTFKKGKSFSMDWIGRNGELFLEDGDTIMAFVPKPQSAQSFTVTGTAGDDLLLGGTIYNWEDAMPVYYKSAQTTYATAYNTAEEGDTFTVYFDADNTAEYALLRKPNTGDVFTSTMETYAVYAVLQDGIITYKDGAMETVKIDDGVTLYKDDKAAGVLQKSTLQMGDIIKVNYKDKDSKKVEYVIVDTKGVDGPYTVQNSSWTGYFPLNEKTAIMRNGKKADRADIEVYDILYYSEELNMVLAYTDKVIGIYQNASPSQDVPTSVTVSGKSYAIESLSAFHKLASGGSFSFGDSVTLLLGRNGEVADVATGTSVSENVAGFVLQTGTKSFENNNGESYTGYYLSLMQADGNLYEYETNREYASLLGDVATLTFSDGKANATATSISGVSGKVDAAALRLGESTLSPQVQIIDTYAPSEYDPGSAASVFLQRLDGVTLSSADILYSARDNQNRISQLILKNVTGDLHRYGVVTSAKNNSMGMSVSGAYAYMIDGNAGNYVSTGKTFSIGSRNPACFSYSNGQIYTIKPLSSLSGSITGYTASRITLSDGSRYDITDAAVYRQNSDYSYTLLAPQDVSTDAYTLTAYYDKSPTLGGKIRILIAVAK